MAIASCLASPSVRLCRPAFRSFSLTFPVISPRGLAQILIVQAGDGTGKFARLESFEVARPFPDTDEMYRKLEFLGDRDEDAAARGSVELGHDKTGDAGDTAENLDLVDRVLADRRVEDENHGVRRGGIDLFHDAYDFFKFGHELGPVLQPPGGVHQHHPGATFPRRLDRIESQSRGIAALFVRDDRTMDALPPNAQLLDRGGAERVAGGKQNASPVA